MPFLSPDRLSLVFCCFILAACILGPIRPSQAATAESSVLQIHAGHGSTQNIGTAFYIHPNILVTSFHVIQGARTITAKHKEFRIELSSLLAYDPDLDLALLYMPLQGSPLPLGDEHISAWTTLQSMGFVQGGSVQKVPAILQVWNKIKNTWHLVLQGQIKPGMSGGPVLNEQGQVVGVNRFAAASENVPIAQAVGVRAVHQILNQALQTIKFTDLATFAEQTSITPQLNIENDHIVITDE